MELILTRWIALAGTAAAAERYADRLRQRFPAALINEAKAFAGLANTKEDEAAAKKAGAEGVWQLGEGGIFSALWRMAEERKTGLWIDVRAIPIRQETVEICEFFDMNPYYLQSEGALLLLTRDGYAAAERLKSAGLPAAVIGRTEKGNDRILYNQGNCRYLDRPQRDEIYKLGVFENERTDINFFGEKQPH